MQTCRHTKKSPTCIRTKFRATVLVLRTKGGRRTTTAAAHAPSVETGCGKFVTNVPSFGKFRSREVTVCDGTFPDFATSLHGQDTRIGRRSFGGRETGAPSPTATGSAPSGCNDLLRRNPERTDTILSPRRFLTYFRLSAGEHHPRTSESGNMYYQLAFVTPGIRPLEAISRNWIRLMPNRRM